MFDMLYCALIKFANILISFLFSWWVELLIWVLDLLPEADFSADPLEWGVFGTSLGYFIPVGTMALHFASILGALTLYFAVQHILRLVKMIG